jgi:hypothetical protein
MPDGFSELHYWRDDDGVAAFFSFVSTVSAFTFQTPKQPPSLFSSPKNNPQ